MLVLDEATSSIDTETERLIREALHVLMRDRTTIAIAHRLSTIQDMDRILVFHKGRAARVAARIRSCSDSARIYRRLYELQFSGSAAAETIGAAGSAS